MADQGTEPDRWTSTRMRREVLYLESRHRRFELAQTSSGGDGEFARYTFSEVVEPHALDRRAMITSGVPLPARHVKRLHENVDWEEVPPHPSPPLPTPPPSLTSPSALPSLHTRRRPPQPPLTPVRTSPDARHLPPPSPRQFVWGPCFLRLRGDEYPLVRALFTPHTMAS